VTQSKQSNERQNKLIMAHNYENSSASKLHTLLLYNYMYICVRMCIYVYMYMYVCICMYIYVYMCIYVCIYIYVYLRVYVYMYK